MILLRVLRIFVTFSRYLFTSIKRDDIFAIIHLFLKHTGWNPSNEIPWDMCAAYLLQASFYLHATWATCALDEWKKDSPLLLTHHVVTITLMGTSYAYRYTQLINNIQAFCEMVIGIK